MLGSVDWRGSSVVWMVMPVALALGGRKVRKRRAALAWREKGLNFVVTCVRNLEIIVTSLTGLWIAGETVVLKLRVIRPGR